MSQEGFSFAATCFKFALYSGVTSALLFGGGLVGSEILNRLGQEHEEFLTVTLGLSQGIAIFGVGGGVFLGLLVLGISSADHDDE
jgi:hypothetical protein